MPAIPSRFGVVICLCFAYSVTCRAGVPVDSALTVEIRWLHSPRSLPTLLQYQCTEHLTHWLKLKRVGVAERAKEIFWCDVYTFAGPDSDKAVLSVGFGQSLPLQVIELGKKAEILYTGLPAKKKAALQKSGTWVRQSLSEDFLYEYMKPLDQEVVIVEKSRLLDRLDEIAELLYQRHLKQQTVGR